MMVVQWGERWFSKRKLAHWKNGGVRVGFSEFKFSEDIGSLKLVG